MDKYLYYKSITGHIYSDLHSLENIARINNLEEATEEDAFSSGYSKVRITDAPDDGYAYTISEIEDVDGVLQTKWVRIWEQTRAEELVQLAQLVRNERSAKLMQSDWTQLVDAPLDAPTKQSWATYRQLLRDVTTQDKFPWRVVWPIPPS